MLDSHCIPVALFVDQWTSEVHVPSKKAIIDIDWYTGSIHTN